MGNEIFMQRGSQFHQMVQQYLLGVPEDKIAGLVENDEILSRWWQNFLDHRNLPGFEILEGLKVPEISLSAPIGDYRIMAKYDLLLMKTLRVPSENSDREADVENPKGFSTTIYDWKTSLKRPQREWLIGRLQTMVYPYLLVKAGAQINNRNPISPDQIEMIYWFTDYPDQPAHFPYSQEQFEADETYLTKLISEIENLGDEDALLTDDERRCRYCRYRSLCNRGVEAGPLDEIDDEGGDEGFELDLDFEQVAEIEF